MNDEEIKFRLTINEIARRHFRDQADWDYISARAIYRIGARQQFVWLAQQSLEKYLKAILLFNNCTSICNENGEPYIHDLVKLLKSVKKIEFLKFNLNADDEGFLTYISVQGVNRYLTKNALIERDALNRYDQLIWRIRRYCQIIPDRGLGCKAPIEGMRESYIRMINSSKNVLHPSRFRILGGKLEDILNDKNHTARKCLIWGNAWFGRSTKTCKGYVSFERSVMSKNNIELTPTVIERILKYVKIPKADLNDLVPKSGLTNVEPNSA